MGIKRRQLVMDWCLLLMVFGVSPSTWAEGNLHAGNTEIRTHVKIEQKYDDNVFFDPSDEKDDYVTRLSGGVRLDLPLRDHKLELGYDLSREQYWDLSNQSFNEHIAFVKAELESPSGFGVRIKDTFKSTADRPDEEDVIREERVRNVGSINLDYDMNLLTFDLGYANVLDDYADRDFLDRVEATLNLTASYKLFPKTSMISGYSYGWISYDEATSKSDADYHQLEVGVTGELTPKLVGVVKGGYQLRDYNRGDVDDFDGGVITVNLIEDFSERTQVKLTGNWGVAESAYDPNNYYRFTRVNLEFDQKLANNFSLNFLGSFDKNKYPEESTESGQSAKRDDDVLAGAVGLSYQTQDWLSIGMRYRRKERSSNLDVFDYSDNQLSIEASITY